MRKFLNRLKFFLFFITALLLVCLFLNKHIVDKLFELEAKLPVNAKWLAIGDSHITNAINPEEYPELQNRAHSGERLLYNFEKIKLYINHNPQVELVILGYWYNSLLYDMDWVLYGKDTKYRYESYIPLMLFNQTDVNYFNVPINRNLFLENYWGYKLGYPSPTVRLMVKNYLTFNRNLEMKGGYLKAKKKYRRSEITQEKDTSRIQIDTLALNNLRDIVNYLQSKNVKLILYNTPVRAEFFAPLNEYNVYLTDSIAESFTNDSTIWYINHSNYDIPDDFFNDRHHLNQWGANYMTPILIDSIRHLTGLHIDKISSSIR